MKRITLGQHARPLSVLFLAGLLGVSGAQGESLEQAWELGIAANHQLRSSKELVVAAEHQVAAAEGARLPSIEFGASATALDAAPQIQAPFGPVQGGFEFMESSFYRYRTAANLPVFTGGRITNVIGAAQARYGAARAQSETAVQELKLAIAKAYVDVLRAGQAVRVARRAVKSLSRHLLDADNRHQQGLVARTHVLSGQAALASARQGEIAASNALVVARAAYNRITGREIAAAVEVEELSPPPRPPVSYAELVDAARSSRPEIRALEEQEHALRRQARAAFGESLPQVSISGGYDHIENRNLVNEGIWSVSLGLNWSLYDGNTSRNKRDGLVRQAESVYEQRLELDSIIELQVKQAWLSVHEALRRIAVAADGVSHAEENLRMTSNRYREGLASNTEVLDAERQLTESQADRANAVYDAVLSDLSLNYAVGGL